MMSFHVTYMKILSTLTDIVGVGNNVVGMADSAKSLRMVHAETLLVS